MQKLNSPACTNISIKGSVNDTVKSNQLLWMRMGFIRPITSFQFGFDSRVLSQYLPLQASDWTKPQQSARQSDFITASNTKPQTQ